MDKIKPKPETPRTTEPQETGAKRALRQAQNPRIASAAGRVKPLRGSYAALRPCAGDSTPLLWLKALVWPKGSFRPGKPGPNPPFFPRKQRSPSDRPGAVQGAKRRSEPLTARTDLESLQARGKGLAQRNGFATIRPRTCLQGLRRCETVLQNQCD